MKTAAFRGLPIRVVTAAADTVAACAAVAGCAEADAGVEQNFLKYRRKIPS
jgi:hypothetical protein